MLQGAPYQGHRHLGMPAAGAADCLSLFLANQLVGNRKDELALEISMSGATFVCETDMTIALTGAVCDFQINKQSQSLHKSISVEKGDHIFIGPAKRGFRSYLAISFPFEVSTVLGSNSTYQPAALGGFHGRTLQVSDTLPIKSTESSKSENRSTPAQFVPSMLDSVILRVTPGPEFSWLSDQSQNELYKGGWSLDQRMSRMGMMMIGKTLKIINPKSLPSAAVFPGTIQCPPDGSPFLLGPDAQTSGGYPRIANIIKADRHLTGQLRPGTKLQLVSVTPEQAMKIYQEKLVLLKPWLGNVRFW